MRSRIIQKNNHSETAAAAPIEDIRHILEDCRRILVASHIDPDGDAIGTQLAFASYLRNLEKEVFLVREAEVPAKYRFLYGIDSITDVNSYDKDFSVDAALILECPNVTRIGQARRLLTPEVKIINIDHHQDNEGFGDVNWVDTQASSVGEMAFEYFSRVGYRISTETAEQLYTAVLTDTGRFRYSSTSSRTMAVVGQLIEAGADPQKICDNVYYNMRPSTMKLIGKVLNSVEFFDKGSICLLALTRQMLDQCGAEDSEAEGIVDFTLFTRGVLVGALLKGGNPGRTKVSLRSRDDIDVAALASRFGGGGHPNASGCVIPLPLPEAKKELIKLLREARDGRAE
jgi:phosphoesterase RecJ-like protein